MKKWTKVIYSLGVLVMVAPNFVTAGTALAETVDSHSAETVSSSIEETQPSKEEETTEDAAKTAEAEAVMEQQKQANDAKLAEAQHQAEMQSRAPETSATTETEGEAQQGKEQNEKLVSEEQLNQLQAKLPEGSEVIFENGKLTIKLPAGVEPEVGKSAVAEMGLQDVAGLEIEVQGKKASDKENSDNSYWYGYSIAYMEIEKKVYKYAGGLRQLRLPSLEEIATVLDLYTDPNIKANSTKKDSKGNEQIVVDTSSRILNSNLEDKKEFRKATALDDIGVLGPKDEYKPGKAGMFATTYNVNRAELLHGYNDMIKDYIAGVNAYIDQVSGKKFENKLASGTDPSYTEAKVDADQMKQSEKLAKYTNYDPGAADPNSNFWKVIQGIMQIGGQQVIDSILRLFGINQGLDGYAPEIWGFDSSDKKQNLNDKVSNLVRGTQGQLIDYIKIILPTVQNILVKQVLTDPVSIGGESGIKLPDHLSDALAKNENLRKITEDTFDMKNAIGSSIADRIYLGVRDSVKKSLIAYGMKGVTEQIQVSLSGKTPRKNLMSINNSADKSQVLNMARDAGFTLAGDFIDPVKKSALSDALSGKRETGANDLFANLFTTDPKFKANQARLSSADGDAARIMLYKVYQMEYEAAVKAVKDFKADPLTDPSSLTAKDLEFKQISPVYSGDIENATEDDYINVLDYKDIRIWLYNASKEMVRQGIAGADELSHEELRPLRLDADVTAENPKTDELKTTPADKVKLDAVSIANADKLVNTGIRSNQNLVEIAKNGYMYGFNAEIPRLKKAFKNGAALAINARDYRASGPDEVNPLDQNDKYGLLTNDDGGSGTKKTYFYDGTSIFGPLVKNPSITDNSWLKIPIAVEGKDYRGRAFYDGVLKQIQDYGLKLNLNITGYDLDEKTKLDAPSFQKPTNIYEGRYVDDWTTYVFKGQESTLTFNMPDVNGFELMTKNTKFEESGYTFYKVILSDSDYKESAEKLTMNNGSFTNPKIENAIFKKVQYSQASAEINYVRTIDPQVVGNKKDDGKYAEKPTGKGNDKDGYVVTGYMKGSKDEKEFVPSQVITKPTDPKEPFTKFTIEGKVETPTSFTVDEDGKFTAKFGNLTAGTKTSLNTVVTPVYKNKYGKITAGEDVEFDMTVSVDSKTKLAFNEEMTDTKDRPLGDKPQGSTVSVPFYWSDSDIGDELYFTATSDSNPEAVIADKDVTVVDGQTKGQKIAVIKLDKDKFAAGSGYEYTILAHRKSDGEPVSDNQIKFRFNVIEGTLGMKVTTGNQANMLSWTNRKPLPTIDGENSYRDTGNTIDVSVSDYRPVNAGNWHLMINTAGENSSNFYFTWNGTRLTNDSSVLVMRPDKNSDVQKVDDNNWKQSWDNAHGVLLKADQPVKAADYSSTSSTDKSQQIVWTLHDTLAAD